MDGWAPRDGDEVTQRLGPYRLVTRIGEGGMGVVYLGLDKQRRTVAVKVLRPHVAADDVSRARLAREVETMRCVTSPHVAEVLDADLSGERPYIVTRYVQGRTLSETLREDGPLAGAALTRVARGLAEALSAIHASGIVHRDVKPGTVVLVDGEPVIIDFGVAQAVDATRLTQTGSFIGTPAYLAPEILSGADPVSGTDVHAWGAVVAFAATGHPPFGSGSYEHVFSNITQGKADLSGVPDPLAGLVRAALARDPAARPSATWLQERAGSLDGRGVAVPASHARSESGKSEHEHRGGRTRVGRWVAAAGAWAAGGAALGGAAGSGSGSDGVASAQAAQASETPRSGPNRARTWAYTGQGGSGGPPATQRSAGRVPSHGQSGPYGGQPGSRSGQAPPQYGGQAPRPYGGQAPPYGNQGPVYGTYASQPAPPYGGPPSGTRPYTAYSVASPPYPPDHPYGAPATTPYLPPAPPPEEYYRPHSGRPPTPTAYPPPPRPRPLVGWLLLLLVAGFMAIAPVLGAIGVAVVVTGLRASDGVATSLAARRSRRGPRDVDPVLSVAGLPWHVFKGTVGTAVTLIIPVLGAVAVGGILVVGDTGVPTIAAALAACVFVLLTFFGPGGRKPRQRAAGTLSMVLRGRAPTIITIVVIVLFIMLELSSIESRLLIWWPLDSGLMGSL